MENMNGKGTANEKFTPDQAEKRSTPEGQSSVRRFITRKIAMNPYVVYIGTPVLVAVSAILAGHAGHLTGGAKPVGSQQTVETASPDIMENCNGRKVDLSRDTENCGGCGNVCGKDEECQPVNMPYNTVGACVKAVKER